MITGSNEPQPQERIELDPLDAMLQEATWADIGPERVERLRRQWNRLKRSRRRRRRRLSILAGLCVIAGALGIAQPWRGDRLDRPRGDGPAEARQMAHVPKDAHTGSTRSGHPSRPETARDAVRQGESTGQIVSNYERLMIRTIEKRWAQRNNSPKTRVATSGRIEDILQQLVRGGSADLRQLAQALLDEGPGCENQLLTLIPHCQGSRQVAAVRLLSQVATSKSMPILLRYHAWPPVRAEVIDALARVADPLTLARLARSESSPEASQKLLAGLLGRGTAEALTLFLNLASHPELAESARQAAQELDHPPVDLLFEFLQGPRVSMRLAAARVLGAIDDDPAVTRRLVQVACSVGAGREALVALLASKDPLAKRFVDHAQRDSLLAGSVRAAQLRLYSFPPSTL